jgi:hypothetical protein
MWINRNFQTCVTLKWELEKHLSSIVSWVVSFSYNGTLLPRLELVRTARRNSGNRGKFLIRGPYIFPKLLARGWGGGEGGGREEKTFSWTYSKTDSKNSFRTNTSKIKVQTHFFGPIPVKLRSKRFLLYHYLYKNVTNFFFKITPFGDAFLQILGTPLIGSPVQMARFAPPPLPIWAALGNWGKHPLARKIFHHLAMTMVWWEDFFFFSHGMSKTTHSYNQRNQWSSFRQNSAVPRTSSFSDSSSAIATDLLRTCVASLTFNIQ